MIHNHLKHNPDCVVERTSEDIDLQAANDCREIDGVHYCAAYRMTLGVQEDQGTLVGGAGLLMLTGPGGGSDDRAHPQIAAQFGDHAKRPCGKDRRQRGRTGTGRHRARQEPRPMTRALELLASITADDWIDFGYMVMVPTTTVIGLPLLILWFQP